MRQNGRRTGGKRHLTNVPQECKIKENKNGAARTATVSPNQVKLQNSRSVFQAGAAISASSFYRCFRWRIRHRSKLRTRRVQQSGLQSSASASPSFHSISARRRIMLKRVTVPPERANRHRLDSTKGSIAQSWKQYNSNSATGNKKFSKFSNRKYR